MADPFAKIKPITFLRTVDALLLRPDCHERKKSALNEARSLFQATGDKNKIMLQLLECYTQLEVVPTMQKLMTYQETDAPLAPQVLLQAAMFSAPGATPPLQQPLQPSTTPPPNLQHIHARWFE
mmetsp:Transcript_24314/g.66484  ORF Transcript_24314/g.66484 Transcript_24314/m.66484 type:complete len:124 (-) Transcript_24314:372-743(-)|eukprot:CAMPEP_0202369678 /NCGR_PEP_ID=MMETSP1127-20130417/1463_1 /ASSEMBLY_ACC=CAM_ASM_000462 /TAXON_ID=3047 /ORGANISM="Dunaliella tertiolecta, Strain CCMP1320" /LENGTH=123 /DNA_ID=CAMNT_0048965403 /DNA_START=55 /DNA_END=426 /DNA_ORIENTATION=+